MSKVYLFERIQQVRILAGSEEEALEDMRSLYEEDAVDFELWSVEDVEDVEDVDLSEQSEGGSDV